MVSLQIISDVHLELEYSVQDFNMDNFIRKWIKLPRNDSKVHILGLLGDICCVANAADFEIYKDFVRRLSKFYSYLLITTGNHEYYNVSNRVSGRTKSVPEVNSMIDTFCKTLPNAFFLNNKSFGLRHPSKDAYLIFYGCTLWTFIDPYFRTQIRYSMNDYEYIWSKPKEKFSPSASSQLHENQVKYLARFLEKIDKKTILIVLTHHKPYINFNFQNRYNSIVHQAYETDLKPLFRKTNIKYWCYGHTHKADTTKKYGICFLSNPKGYRLQRDVGYDRNVVIDF